VVYFSAEQVTQMDRVIALVFCGEGWLTLPVFPDAPAAVIKHFQIIAIFLIF
jgi:hypothetical protein